MPKIVPVKWQVLACIFQKDGFVWNRQKASHRVYEKDGILRPVIIPIHKKPIDVNIIKSNMRTAKMSRERYFELLAECL